MTSISVIMPVYNSEKYLPQAIDSVLGQSFHDFELILVDDGSKDTSGDICDQDHAKDGRITVKHVANGGMCRARNLAIDCANGEYIAFCDNDDMFLPGLLSENYAIAKKSGADVVRFQRELVLFDGRDDSPRVSIAGPTEKHVYRNEDVFLHYGEVRAGSDGVWNGLYKRSFLNQFNIRFDEKMHSGCEDNLFNTQCYARCTIVATNPNPYYRWIRRSSHSTSFSINDNFYYGLKKVVETDYKVMTRNSVSREYFGNRMVGYLLSPLEVALLKRDYSESDLKKICSELVRIFEQYSDEILACPLKPSYSVIFRAVMKENIKEVAACLRLSQIYLSLTKALRKEN